MNISSLFMVEPIQYAVMVWLFILTIIVAAVAYLAGEFVRRKLGLRNEVSRKLVHSIHAVLIAIWPFIIGYRVVIAVEVLFILSVFAARKLSLFKWMWQVGRRSRGEIFFPLGVIAAALLAGNKWIYLAAILQLGLADALAAIVGKKFGRGNTYRVFGQYKSIAGSIAFYVVSLLILLGIAAFTPIEADSSYILALSGLPVILTITENVGVYGWDNFIIPLIAVVALNLSV